MWEVVVDGSRISGIVEVEEISLGNSVGAI
jgi:hypothetical protein